jgi:LDH2 family malate/lactate/ureidoglycolate dehydrogenase
MAKIYIAGPISGLPNFNRDAFNAEAHRLLGLGHVALNPAILPDGLEQHEHMAICIEMVKMADQLVMLPGWERSAGARAEHALAIKLGKAIILPVPHLADEVAA